MNTKLIFFDLDGTLADSLESIIISINYVLKKMDKPMITKKEISKFIGKNKRQLIQDITKDTNTSLIKLIKMFLVHHNKNYLDNCKLYNGAIETLNNIKIPMVILTNRKLRYAEKMLKHFNIYDLFEHVIGPETYMIKKPDPFAVVKILSEYNIKPEEAILVGDTLLDKKCAENAGMKFYAASYGYGDKNLSTDADCVLTDIRELNKYL